MEGKELLTAEFLALDKTQPQIDRQLKREMEKIRLGIRTIDPVEEMKPKRRKKSVKASGATGRTKATAKGGRKRNASNASSAKKKTGQKK
jgi:hypothetical protein